LSVLDQIDTFAPMRLPFFAFAVATGCSLTLFAACGGGSETDETEPLPAAGAGGGGGEAGSAGVGGAAGQGGKAGASGSAAGAGGSAAGAGGSAAGAGGAAGNANAAGTAGASGGDAGTAGTAGASGSAGSAGTGAAGTAGTGGSSGGTAGSSGSAGSSGAPPTGQHIAFAAIGDGGKGNTDAKKIGDAVAAKCLKSGCDFVQLLGDNIYDNGVESVSDGQWQTKFVDPYASIDLPFWVVLGNHDYGGNGAGYEENKADVEVAYSQTNPKWHLPARYYHHVEGPAEFFALDTNAQMYGKDDNQRTDFPKWIAASKSPWKIALGHHPYRSNGTHGNAGNYDGIPDFIPIASGKGVKEFAEDVVCGEVDLYLTGHDHSRQWLKETCQGTELVVSGAGAGTTDLPGKNIAYFQAKTIGFAYVEITETTLTITMIDGDGNEEHTRTVTK
jgi:tartrate-resistant acid phosphatase type 5